MVDLKRGDRVKFLNDTGTGTVTRIIDKEMVMVRTDDGFEYPVLGSELIKGGGEFMKLTSSQNYGEHQSDNDYTGEETELPLTAVFQASKSAGVVRTADSVQKREERDERKERDEVSGVLEQEPDIFIAVVPFDHSEPVGGEVSLFIINDSEWSLLYHCAMVKESKIVHTISAGTIEPGIKVNSGDFHIDDLFGTDGSVELTAIAYGERINESAGLFRSLIKPGKEHLSKRSTYIENDFFDEDAFIVRIKKRRIEGDNRRMTGNNKWAAVDDSNRKNDDKENARDNGGRERSFEAGVKAKISEERDIKGVDKPPAGKKDGRKLPREIDLHIGEIVDNSNELTPGEIINIQLARFRTSLEGAIISRERSVVYIHGAGEGKLKHEIRRIIDREYTACSYQDASFREYGYGATLVIIKNRR